MRIAFIICFILVCFFIATIGQTEDNKVIKAVKTDIPPVIDGRLDEACWKEAAKVSDFVQSEPEEGGNPSEKTVVYLLYDDNKFYVGFECFQSKTDFQASATRKDSPFFNDDYVEVFLDTFRDKRNCYAFGLNSLGTKLDARIADEGANQRGGGPGGNNSWDCGWEGQATRGEGKWTAEFAIPFCELRFNNKSNSVWGINFIRSIEGLEEEDSWADVGDESYKVSRYGKLIDLPTDKLVTTRPLEFKPYTVLKPRKTSEWEVFERDRGDIGLDIRYPFSNITLDMTINPDFAQVEADPSRINLSDVPERFPEKRPFFQEGAELFRTPIDIFYTRKIENPIVGAKAAGKVGSYNIALLDAQTERKVQEEEDEDEDDNYSNNFFVFRLQRDIGERSSIGFLGINKQNVDNYNRAAGIDGKFSLSEDFRVSGQYAYTHSPDIGSDSDALLGTFAGDISDFFLMLRLVDIGENFEAKSGFVPESRIDRRGGSAEIHYRRRLKDSILRRVGGGLEYDRLYNHAGKLTNERGQIGFDIGIGDFFLGPEFEWYYHPVEEDDGKTKYYTDKNIGMFGGWFPPKWATLFTRMQIGKRDGKDSFFIGPSLRLKPTNELGMEYEIQRVEHGDELDIINRFTVEYRFTQNMHLRTNYELTDDDKTYAFVLYSWEFRPESNLFLVYTQDKDSEKEYTEHTFFTKVSYLMKWKPF